MTIFRRHQEAAAMMTSVDLLVLPVVRSGATMLVWLIREQTESALLRRRHFHRGLDNFLTLNLELLKSFSTTMVSKFSVQRCSELGKLKQNFNIRLRLTVAVEISLCVLLSIICFSPSLFFLVFAVLFFSGI